MDSLQALFKKIRGRDRASFQALSDSYGWKLYSYIRRNTEDREEADQIFSRSFSNFYENVEKYDCDDPIETLLYLSADQAKGSKAPVPSQKPDLGQWEIGVESGFSLPEVKVEKPRESLGLRIFYGICIALLVVGILAALWILAWMLMSMNILPELDLGYTWFNEHIADFF